LTNKRNQGIIAEKSSEKMLEKINPKAIICYGKTFSEMEGNIIETPYFRNKKEVA